MCFALVNQCGHGYTRIAHLLFTEELIQQRIHCIDAEVYQYHETSMFLVGSIHMTLPMDIFMIFVFKS